MIVAHPSKRECMAAMERYLAALERLALPFHPPTECVYSAKHWDAKSRAPYCWGGRRAGAVPWVSFVGYQLRFDGKARVRRTSITKHLEKQVAEVQQVVGSLQKAQWTTRRSRASVLEGVYRRLISLSVGRVPAHRWDQELGTYCWTDGFKELRAGPHDETQLRSLDRGRSRQIRRLKNILWKHMPNSGTETKGKTKRDRARRPAGFTLSYVAQYRNRAPTAPVGHTAPKRDMNG